MVGVKLADPVAYTHQPPKDFLRGAPEIAPAALAF